MSVTLPTGTLTFLFTDIEGSTKLLQQLGGDFEKTLTDHHRLIREVVSDGGGVEVSTEGDAFFVVFPAAPAAVVAAAQAQRALAGHDWGNGVEVKVRMGLHTGEGKLAGDNYGGIDVHRAARIASAAHGGQIILSEATRALVGKALPEHIQVKDLGEHRLKDLDHPEHLYQACVAGLPTDFPPPRSLDAHPNNLPSHLSGFIPRDHQVAEIVSLLSTNRIVTLTGPGGTGKTRLSIEVASRLLDDFADGVFFIALAAVDDPELVAHTIAQTLAVREHGTQPITETIRDHLSNRSLLLVLDNFEQILDASSLVGDLLGAGPDVKALVTSRAPLKIYGEQEYPVPPMTLPDPTHLPSLAVLASYEAVALFLRRAQEIKPGFELTDENANVIVEICERLDGLPLAIELAAARLRLFGPQEILERLKNSLTLLTGGARDLPQRQQTLRDAIAWSYDLLDESQRMFFRRLSVFQGGWTFAAAEEVAAAGSDIDYPFETIESLVDHSLIRRTETPWGETRFRMLQTIRGFALEMARAESGWAELQESHARFFMTMAEERASEITRDKKLIDPIAEELDNFRAVFQWTLDTGRPDLGIQMGVSLWRFWQIRGHYAEGRMLMTQLLDHHTTPDAVRARGLMAIGSIAYWQNDYEATGHFYSEGLEIFRSLGDKPGIAEATYNRAFVYQIAHEFEEARVLYQEAYDLFAELGAEQGLANAAWGLGLAAVGLKDLDAAERYGNEAKRRFVEQGDWFGSQMADFVAFLVFRFKGEYEAAVELMMQTLEDSRVAGDEASVASFLDIVGNLEITRGNAERGLTLMGASAAMKERVGGQAPPELLFIEEDPKQAAAQHLSPDEIEAAWNKGAELSLPEAVAHLTKDRKS